VTPTEFELGEMSRELKEVRHDLRNHRLILDATIDDVSRLHGSLSRLKTQIATGIAAVVIVSAVVAWIVEMVWN